MGCVPSKGLIRAANAWAEIRHAEDFGLHIPPGVTYDFGEAMARMRKLRARISRNDSLTGISPWASMSTSAKLDSPGRIPCWWRGPPVIGN